MSHRKHRNQFEFPPKSKTSAPGTFLKNFAYFAARTFESRARAMQTLFDKAMKLARGHLPAAQRHERTYQPRGCAHGYKPKTAPSHQGTLELDRQQAREISLCPTAPLRGTRSQRAFTLAQALDCCS